MTNLSAHEISQKIANIASEKKAENIIIYHVEDITSVAEYFVVCSGMNERQLQAISDDIKKDMKETQIPIIGIEGYNNATWILLDLGGVVMHIFNKETRSFYDLDILWGDAPKIEWEPENTNIAIETEQTVEV